MYRLNVKLALDQNVPDLLTNRIVGFILGETHAQGRSTHLRPSQQLRAYRDGQFA